MREEYAHVAVSLLLVQNGDEFPLSVSKLVVKRLCSLTRAQMFGLWLNETIYHEQDYRFAGAAYVWRSAVLVDALFRTTVHYHWFGSFVAP